MSRAPTSQVPTPSNLGITLFNAGTAGSPKERSPKPHRPQFAEIDICSPGQILAGWRCFTLSTSAKTEAEESFWWKLGEECGDYRCIDRLNRRDRKDIDEAISNKSLSSEKIEEILWRARRAAQLHGTVGYGMLAETLSQLGRYHHKRLLAWRDTLNEMSPLPSRATSNYLQTNYHGMPPKPYSIWNSFDEYIRQRDTYCQLAIISMQVAIELEPHCSDLTYNATEEEEIFRACKWWHTNAYHLENMLEYYCKYYHRVRSSKSDLTNADDLIKIGREKGLNIVTTKTLDASLSSEDINILSNSPRTFRSI